MTALDPVKIPPCPYCGGEDATRTPSDKAHLGRFFCTTGSCWSFYDGTQSEWERYEEARTRRQEARE